MNPRLSGAAVPAGFAAFLSLFAVCAAAETDAACADAPAIVAQLRQGWQSPAVAIAAAGSAAMAAPVAAGAPVRTRLRPARDVSLRAPGKRTEGHGGIFSLSVPAPGLYRVMASQRVWLEMLLPDGPPLPVYMRPLRCLRAEGVAKELIYSLASGVAYQIEISAATDAALDFMVVAEPAP